MKNSKKILTLVLTLMLCGSYVYANAPSRIYKHPWKKFMPIIYWIIPIVFVFWCISNIIKIHKANKKKKYKIYLYIVNFALVFINCFELVTFYILSKEGSLDKASYIILADLVILVLSSVLKILKRGVEKGKRFISIGLLMIESVILFCYVDTMIMYKLGLSAFQDYYECGPGLSQMMLEMSRGK